MIATQLAGNGSRRLGRASVSRRIVRANSSRPVPSAQSVFSHVANEGKLLLESGAVEIERVLLDLVQNDDDRRLRGKAADQAQPVFGIGILAPLAAGKHQEVEAALGEEELVRGVHDLLPAEVPYVQADLLAIVQAQGPIGYGDPFGLPLVRIEAAMNQALDQGCLPGGFTFLTLVLSAELWACRDGGRE